MPYKYNPPIPPLIDLALQDFSYSRIDTYERCNLRYFYQYIIKIPQTFGDAALLGNIIHKGLEISAQENTLAKPSEMLRNYRAAIDELDPDHQIFDQMIQEGEHMILEFIDALPAHEKDPSYQPVYEKDFFTELAFSVQIGKGRFNGYIDKVDIEPTMVKITDYKSGKREVAAKSIGSNLQLGIYSVVMKEIYPDSDVFAQLYYLRSGKKKGHLFTDSDLEFVKIALNDKVEQILNTSDYKPTPNVYACDWCSYATDGTCPTGAYRLKKRGVLR